MKSQQANRVSQALQDALAQARTKGAQAAKVFFSRRESQSCEFQAGRLKSVETEADRGAEISVVARGRLGQAVATRLEDLGEALDRALALAQVGQEVHFDEYPPPQEPPEVARFDQRVADLTREQLIEESTAVLEAIGEYDLELHLLGGAGRETLEAWLATSSGLEYSSRRTGWHLYGHAQRTEQDDVLFCGASRHGLELSDQFQAEKVSARVLEDLRMSQSMAKPPRGKVPVLFGPRVMSSLIRAIGMGLSGRRVAKGESPLAGKLSERIAHESLTLIDDPLTDFAVGAREIDDCGVPTRRMAVIEQGVLKSYLYDWDSAHLAGAEATGHTNCVLTSPVLKAGRHEQQELISAMGEGLFVRSLAGFGQGNIINGDFAANVALGWRIENGRLTGRVKDTMISGNLYEILRNPVLTAREVDPVNRMPATLLEGVTVSARS